MQLGEARRLLGPDGPLARGLPGYEDRAGQLAMADAVERALEGDRALLCEAGTGTGKTLAYLVPAILSGRKVIVSTATKALEDQIFHKDVPLIAEHLRLDPQAALVKGLGNYLCLRRFGEYRTSVATAEGGEASRALPLLEAWARQTESGDVAELAALSEGHPLWREVSSSSETRIGAGCAHHEECFVTRMKRESADKRLLIVNHHLFFADLALKRSLRQRAPRYGSPGGALPPYEAVVFDEAHQLEDVAAAFMGIRVSGARVEALLRDADRAFVATGLADRLRSTGKGSVLVALARDALERLTDELSVRTRRARGFDEIGDGREMLARDAWSGDLLAAYHALDAALDTLATYADANAVTEVVRAIGERSERLRADLAAVVEPATHQIAWIERRGPSVAIGATPVDVGRVLREEVFERLGAVILTSATLAAGGATDFRFVRSRMGLESSDVPVDELAVASPFDFAERAILYLPRDLPEVTDAAFIPRAAERVSELCELTGGGAFVLCTSVRAMRELAALVGLRTTRTLLVQGQAPKSSLLGRFRADGNAVLVATMSFWEGVDVPGDALRLVIIDKLPFAVPTDPLVAARCAAIEQAGHNAFQSYAVPQAAITLKQGFGRLLRSQRDRGIVAVLDRRIVTRGYGRTLVASLPPVQRTHDLAEVRAFWARVTEPSVP